MNDNEAAIVQQIERLDHPDAKLQDAVLTQFSRRPDEVRPVVLEHFPQVGARVRRALLRWLTKESNPQITLPLMRYVFDETDTVAEQTGRSMAMSLLLDRARSTDQPEERGRLRAFAEDMSDDASAEVRRLALRILAYVGDERSKSHAEAHLDDGDSEVRDAARQALEALADAPSVDDEPDDDPDALRRQLLQSAGPRRRHLVRRWKRHDERSAIAVDILRRRGVLRSEALQVLLNAPDADARPYLASMVLGDPDGELAALSLRVLARLASSGAQTPRSDELQAIRRGIESDAMWNRAAACAAVSAFGLEDFAPRLVDLAQSCHLPVALEAAKGLDGLIRHDHDELLHHLVDALRLNERRRRRHNHDRDCVRIVAHLLSAIRDVLTASTIGVERLRRLVVDILAAGGTHRSLRVTGLQVLLASTPPEGVESFRRWSDDQVEVLIDLLEASERQALRRIATLLWRVAPRRAYRLDEAAETIWHSDAVDVADVVVPLLDRADTPRSLEMLEEIADGADPAAQRVAKDVLRRRRNERDVIDVDFIPRDDDTPS